MTDLPYELSVVEWVDASRLNDGWMDMVAIPAPYPHRCITVGFVVSRNDCGMILVPTIGDVDHAENSHTYGGMMIPRAAILSERLLAPRRLVDALADGDRLVGHGSGAG
jgi:hypothetical protein